MRLLVVEDEADLAALLREALARAGFALDVAGAVDEAEDYLAVARYDAMLLDLGLPDGDGLVLLDRLRRRGQALPVLILTARDGPDHRVAGLDLGADDYLVKPFHMPELVSRIRALLRRPHAALGIRLAHGNLTLDTVSRETRIDGAAVALSVRETTLLELLLRRQGRVVVREALEQGLYDLDSPPGSNAMEVMVHRLRRKLGDHGAALQIHTLRGVGYLLGEAE